MLRRGCEGEKLAKRSKRRKNNKKHGNDSDENADSVKEGGVGSG